ncbi:MAG: hypothetical protein AB7O97_13900 [Planctomycetota bacterium]
MARAPIDDLLHRVNNLLGTIELQAAAAGAAGTQDAHEQALRRIVESAQRTADEVRRFRAGGGGAITRPAAN